MVGNNLTKYTILSYQFGKIAWMPLLIREDKPLYATNSGR